MIFTTMVICVLNQFCHRLQQIFFKKTISKEKNNHIKNRNKTAVCNILHKVMQYNLWDC